MLNLNAYGKGNLIQVWEIFLFPAIWDHKLKSKRIWRKLNIDGYVFSKTKEEKTCN